MKRIKFLLAGLSIVFATTAFGQETPARRGLSLSIGPEAAIPVGSFRDAFKVGFGGSAKLNIPVASNVDVSLSAGYLGFSTKDELDSIVINKNSYTFIPFKGGIRFRTNGGFYVEPQIGYTQTKLKNMEGAGEFTYAGNIGYLIGRAVDLAVRYEAVATAGESAKFIGIRAAYNIPFGRAK
jgi:hypothetical protein